MWRLGAHLFLNFCIRVVILSITFVTFLIINSFIFLSLPMNVDIMVHYCDITWSSWHLKSLSAQLMVQQLVQAYNNENSALLAFCERNRKVILWHLKKLYICTKCSSVFISFTESPFLWNQISNYSTATEGQFFYTTAFLRILQRVSLNSYSIH